RGIVPQRNIARSGQLQDLHRARRDMSKIAVDQRYCGGELERVEPDSAIDRGSIMEIGLAGEDENVVAAAAGEEVCPATPGDGVIAQTGIDGVCAAAAGQSIVEVRSGNSGDIRVVGHAESAAAEAGGSKREGDRCAAMRQIENIVSSRRSRYAESRPGTQYQSLRGSQQDRLEAAQRG